MQHRRLFGPRFLSHALGAALALLILYNASSLLTWLTWHVSSLRGRSGEMHIYSMGVSADSQFGAVLSVAMIIAIPLLLIGGSAQGAESIRRKFGILTATCVPMAFALLAGVAGWYWMGPADDDSPARTVFAVSFGALALLLVLVHWLVLAGGLRLAVRASRADTRTSFRTPPA
jgi:hypothetical protein